MRHVLLLLSLLLAQPAAFVAAQSPNSPSDENPVKAGETASRSNRERAELAFFEEQIRPVLAKHCYECHAEEADDIGGELRVDSKEGLLTGGQSGPAIVPGNVAESLLISALEYHDFEMPPDGQLSADVIGHFRQWVKRGAIDPRDGTSPPPSSKEEATSAERSEHWAFQPIVVPTIPQVDDESWPATDVDRFIRARLTAEGLSPNGDAEPATLIRRVYFDLIGLPPPIDVVTAFRKDPSPSHLAEIVDDLLASRHFGQRWGRHWLDVARYAESAGSSRDVLMLYAWRYRDYVIDAFNRDIPFDRFVTEQIAGDLLPASDEKERRRLQVATGLLALGSKSLNGGNLQNDIVDDQIDVVSKSVLGLTVACARCHDHKFDPIPTADYYSLAGIFHSTETLYGGGTNRPSSRADKAKVYLALGQPLDKAEQKRHKELSDEIAKLDKQRDDVANQIKKLRGDVPGRFRNDPNKPIPDSLAAKEAKQIERYQAALRKSEELSQAIEAARKELGPEPDYALGVQDANRISDTDILVRGEKNQKGDRVERGFLSAIDVSWKDAPLSEQEATIGPQDSAIGPIDESESGRRQLAAWLVHPDNPLTPRVAVNRIWQHLMGRGLVETVDNFGISGVPPTHPELLDYLAHRFVHTHRWSTKAMIRELVLSQTYRLSSEHQATAYAVDPENALRWRMTRRRLEAEPLRDAALAVSGLLRHEYFTGSLVMEIGEGEVGRNINTAVLEKPFDFRTVYLPVIRGIVPEPLKLFDFPEPSNVQGSRDTNTTPTQSLYLMNSPFAIRTATALAQRLGEMVEEDSTEERIRKAYLLCFARPPSHDQIERGKVFLRQIQDSFQPSKEGPQSSESFAWTAYCQTLLASAPFRFIE